MLIYQLTETKDYYYDTTMVAATLGISRSKLKRIIKDYCFEGNEAIRYKNRLLVNERSLTALNDVASLAKNNSLNKNP